MGYQNSTEKENLRIGPSGCKQKGVHLRKARFLVTLFSFWKS
jgi:hypothetical protein